MKHLKLIFLLLIAVSCQNAGDQVSEEDFQQLMTNIAEGWSSQNTELALRSFDEDAIYMEPPNIQYFRGHEQLRPYFDAVSDVHHMEFHNLWFNQTTQSGVGEYTFSYGSDTATVGLVAVELENGKIAFWREYQRNGPTDFDTFLSTENKDWVWHIGNYPEPEDSLNMD